MIKENNDQSRDLLVNAQCDRHGRVKVWGEGLRCGGEG